VLFHRARQVPGGRGLDRRVVRRVIAAVDRAQRLESSRPVGGEDATRSVERPEGPVEGLDVVPEDRAVGVQHRDLGRRRIRMDGVGLRCRCRSAAVPFGRSGHGREQGRGEQGGGDPVHPGPPSIGVRNWASAADPSAAEREPA